MLPPSRPQLAFIWQDAWTALDQAFSGQASMAANLRLNGLLTDLVFSDVAVRQEKPLSRTQEVAQDIVGCGVHSRRKLPRPFCLV
jgi:hypothetical protein